MLFNLFKIMSRKHFVLNQLSSKNLTNIKIIYVLYFSLIRNKINDQY